MTDAKLFTFDYYKIRNKVMTISGIVIGVLLAVLLFTIAANSCADCRGPVDTAALIMLSLFTGSILGVLLANVVWQVNPKREKLWELHTKARALRARKRLTSTHCPICGNLLQVERDWYAAAYDKYSGKPTTYKHIAVCVHCNSGAVVDEVDYEQYHGIPTYVYEQDY